MIERGRGEEDEREREGKNSLTALSTITQEDVSAFWKEKEKVLAAVASLRM